MWSWAAVMFGWGLSCISRLASRSRSQGWAQAPSDKARRPAAMTRPPPRRRSAVIEQLRDVGFVEKLLVLVEAVVDEPDLAGAVEQDGRRHFAHAELLRQRAVGIEDHVDARPELGQERLGPVPGVVDVDGDEREGLRRVGVGKASHV